MHPILLLLASSVAADVPAPRDAVLFWNETALQAIKEAKTPAPVVAHNLAVLHAAIYDAVNDIDRTHAVYHVDATPPLGASMEAAVSGAAYRVLTQLYPKQKKRFDAALDVALIGVADGRALADGLAFGQGAADKILAWRAEDGSDRKGPFVSESTVGIWTPTPPDFTPALLPHWSEVAPFVPIRAGQFEPPAPPVLTSKEYTADFNEVKTLGRADSTKRKAEQTVIAWFWEDGAGTVTPPGHWNRIAQNVALAKKTTLVENARLFALLNFAMADAGVHCWECKYKFRLWRPVSAIRNATSDDNPDTDADADWHPLLPTPPFPSYVSGHSSFSGAAAAVMADVFGDETTVVATSDAFPGMKRTFSSFSSLAQECGRSRIYGGIHYECDNRAGLEMGKALGHYCARTVLRERRDDR